MWREGKAVAFTLDNYFDWTYQGVELPGGPTKTSLNEVQPVETLDDIQRAIADAGPDGTVELGVTCVYLKHEFDQFMPLQPPEGRLQPDRTCSGPSMQVARRPMNRSGPTCRVRLRSA
jgi:hypothetical protein